MKKKSNIYKIDEFRTTEFIPRLDRDPTLSGRVPVKLLSNIFISPSYIIILKEDSPFEAKIKIINKLTINIGYSPKLVKDPKAFGTVPTSLFLLKFNTSAIAIFIERKFQVTKYFKH